MDEEVHSEGAHDALDAILLAVSLILAAFPIGGPRLLALIIDAQELDTNNGLA